MKQSHHFNLFADYYQFYIQDESADGNLSEAWTPAAIEKLMAVTSGTIGIGTVRNTNVPVLIEVLDSAPAGDFQECDMVNECSIEIASGKIVAAGCTDYFPDAARISITPGCYRARIYYYDLDSHEKDWYKIVLWKKPYSNSEVLKQRV